MRKDYSQEIIRGHLDECLANLNYKFNSKAHASTKQILLNCMANFCEVNIDTVRHWLHNMGSLPISETRIKLMCFLDLIGYRVIELENMSESLRGLTEIVAFKLMTISEATKFIGYTKPSSLIRIMYEHRPAPEKKLKIWDTWTAQKEELQQAKQTAYASLPESIFKVLNPEEETAIPEIDSAEKAALCRANFDAMSNLLKFIRLPSFQNLTDQELFALLSNHDIKILSELTDELQKLKKKCLPE